MKAYQKAIELLQQRLKHVDDSVNLSGLEELANAVAAIAKLETTEDVLNISDEKLAELLTFANAKIAAVDEFGIEKQTELQAAKDDDLVEIGESKQDGLGTIQHESESCQDELNTVVDNFATMNDVPEGSTICPTIHDVLDTYDFLQQPDMPFIFGVLSRYNDASWGVANFTTELGYWYNANANTMLSLLAGCHSYTTEYAGFYLEPKLCFLQGLHGNFNKKKFYIKYESSSSQNNYPYAALGCLFVKNKTDEAITSTLNFGGSSHSASYAGASMFVGVPNHTSSAISWTNVYSYTNATSEFSSTASITVPANTTICIILYASSYYYTNPGYYYYVQFIAWRLNSVRSGFLVDGLEIDLEKTWKAWQCPGFTNTYQLFA
jgi:hypothetical protein